jgi:hypothetical protein
MATQTHTVIVDFQSDFSSLNDGVDELVKLGKVDADLAAQFKKTNTEIKAQGDAFDRTAAAASKETNSFKKLSDLMAQFPKSGLNRFLLQIGQELAKAGVSADLFFKKTKEGNELIVPKFDSLKLQLAAVKKRMEDAAKTSGVLSKEYIALREQAGALSNSIRDINSDVANTGSDTRNIDNVVGSISALAGGYSALQGATALFGQESEDLQKALLKVNAAMALATGIQQIANATTKTGSLTRLADASATAFQTAAQRIYTIVTGRATAATLAFKIALASTGIGLVVVAVLALVTAYNSMNAQLSEANRLTKERGGLVDKELRDMERANELISLNADLQGKTNSQVLQSQLANSRESIKLIEDQIAAQKLFISTLTNKKAIIEANDLLLRLLTDRRNLIQSNYDLGIKIDTADKEARDKAAKDAIERQKEINDKALEAAKKARAAGFADFKAGVELQLLETEKGSIRELALRKKLLLQELQISLEAEGITLNQRRLLIQQFFKARKELEKGFNKELIASGIEAEKNRLAAALTNLNLSEDEKLRVRIEFLQISAAAEIEEAEGNAAKIRLINAQLNADVAAAKIESIRKTAADEAALLDARGGAGKRALDAVASNEKMKADIRINAIRQLADLETQAIDREIAANRAANQIKGADQKALEIEYEQLLDKKLQATEAAEKKITDLTIAENKRRQDNDIARIQAAVSGLQQLGEIAAGIAANEQASAQAGIDTEKKRIDELLKAGVISEKEAERRNKKIEEKERIVRLKAAQGQKRLAVFNAFLAIPQAFIAGLTAPFPIGGPIYAGILASLAAIQAGIVASKPLPAFYKGKKNSYSGLGIIGDRGAELLERSDGSMHVALKPETVYLGPKDIVYTAAETRAKMPFVNKEAINSRPVAESFDYVKMAKAMSKGQKVAGGTTINIDKDFISESVASGLMKSNYFGKYYTSKK